MKIDADQLVRSCGESAVSGITTETGLEPLAGPGTPVRPAAYEGGRFQIDRRWWDGNGRTEPVEAVVIDNAPSEANRYEAALELLRAELGLPEVVLDLSSVGALPPHLPERISGFRFPHRNADAYLRDALLDGQKFTGTDVGRAIFDATADRAEALLEWFPQALLYGFWQSHLGKKRSQAKLARSWTSEIVGYAPAATDTKTLGLKGDPLNLTVDDKLDFNGDDQLDIDWSLVQGSARAKSGGKQTEALSNIGHGQALVREADAAPAGVSFAAITQRSTVSFAALRRVATGKSDADPAARALLVALGLVAHVAAFGRSFSLRSGCELRPRQVEWTWLGGAEDTEIEPLSQGDAIELFRDCVSQAEAAGLPVGSRWAADPLVLEPNESLAKAIRATWPLEG